VFEIGSRPDMRLPGPARWGWELRAWPLEEAASGTWGFAGPIATLEEQRDQFIPECGSPAVRGRADGDDGADIPEFGDGFRLGIDRAGCRYR
jgi:hypothetical protein